MSDHARVLELLDAVNLEPARVGPWLAEHRAEVLAAIRTCDRDGSREAGTRLAAAVWAVASHVRDPRWWEELAEAGEALAIADRDPSRLVTLLHGSATTFAAHGDRLRAEERWVRALAVTRREGLPRQGEAVLSALGALYREWGRLGKALDTYLALADLRREADDRAGAAAALAEVGATMHAAGRLRSAQDYFDRADEELNEDTSPAHAHILEWCGRTRWEQGHHGAARRRWSRALAMLVDVDDESADRVRALLATEPDGHLPHWPSSQRTVSSR